MSKDELIARQQLEIEQYKLASEENQKICKDLHLRFYAIGAPLNDNILKFDKAQMLWALEVFQLTEKINY